MTPTGIETSAATYDLDLIIYATGFDAMTGGYDRMNITGAGGLTLRDAWRTGPDTFLGLLVNGFPNMFMVAGPQSGSSSANFPRTIEVGVDWITNLVEHARKLGKTRVEATAEAQAKWSEHVALLYQAMLMRNARSWFAGYNSNVEGHGQGTIRHFVYNGGAPKYNARLVAVARDEYEGITLS